MEILVTRYQKKVLVHEKADKPRLSKGGTTGGKRPGKLGSRPKMKEKRRRRSNRLAQISNLESVKESLREEDLVEGSVKESTNRDSGFGVLGK